jgi:glycerate-2-kinase
MPKKEAEMENIIKNYEELESHGERRPRKVVLDCLTRALNAADTYAGTYRVIHLKGNELQAGSQVFDLSLAGNIYVVGAGKGSFPIARALDEILGDRIKAGVVLVKKSGSRPPDYIEVMEGGHPVPNEASLAGAMRIQKIASRVRKGDLVFVCMTGGCSSLMVLPVEGITLQDKIQVNRLLLKTGAHISEMNAVRKHLSRVKGGGLVRMLHPATVITLTQDTAPEFLPWPDPCVPDPSTFAEAIQVLKNYEIWDQTPSRVKEHFMKGLSNPALETVKNYQGIDQYLFDVANPRDACLAAIRFAREAGYQAYLLSTKIEGESKHVGTVLAGIAKEIQLYGRPFEPPCLLASGGETTVAIDGPAGEGGPNQELVLGFARAIRSYRGISLVSIDSEGTDGPTQIAGGIADGETAGRAKELGIDLFDVLKRHDSSTALKALGDPVLTGDTGTNVINLRMMFIDKKETER